MNVWPPLTTNQEKVVPCTVCTRFEQTVADKLHHSDRISSQLLASVSLFFPSPYWLHTEEEHKSYLPFALTRSKIISSLCRATLKDVGPRPEEGADVESVVSSSLGHSDCSSDCRKSSSWAGTDIFPPPLTGEAVQALIGSCGWQKDGVHVRARTGKHGSISSVSHGFLCRCELQLQNIWMSVSGWGRSHYNFPSVYTQAALFSLHDRFCLH